MVKTDYSTTRLRDYPTRRLPYARIRLVHVHETGRRKAQSDARITGARAQVCKTLLVAYRGNAGDHPTYDGTEPRHAVDLPTDD